MKIKVKNYKILLIILKENPIAKPAIIVKRMKITHVDISFALTLQ
jgi:hypothetical protein